MLPTINLRKSALDLRKSALKDTFLETLSTCPLVNEGGPPFTYALNKNMNLSSLRADTKVDGAYQIELSLTLSF